MKVIKVLSQGYCKKTLYGRFLHFFIKNKMCGVAKLLSTKHQYSILTRSLHIK